MRPFFMANVATYLSHFNLHTAPRIVIVNALIASIFVIICMAKIKSVRICADDIQSESLLLVTPDVCDLISGILTRRLLVFMLIILRGLNAFNIWLTVGVLI